MWVLLEDEGKESLCSHLYRNYYIKDMNQPLSHFLGKLPVYLLSKVN